MTMQAPNTHLPFSCEEGNVKELEACFLTQLCDGEPLQVIVAKGASGLRTSRPSISLNQQIVVLVQRPLCFVDRTGERIEYRKEVAGE